MPKNTYSCDFLIDETPFSIGAYPHDYFNAIAVSFPTNFPKKELIQSTTASWGAHAVQKTANNDIKSETSLSFVSPDVEFSGILVE
jgi:hypothetical protein